MADFRRWTMVYPQPDEIIAKAKEYAEVISAKYPKSTENFENEIMSAFMAGAYFSAAEIATKSVDCEVNK
jgi:hypothetical protein